MSLQHVLHASVNAGVCADKCYQLTWHLCPRQVRVCVCDCYLPPEPHYPSRGIGCCLVLQRPQACRFKVRQQHEEVVVPASQHDAAAAQPSQPPGPPGSEHS